MVLEPKNATKASGALYALISTEPTRVSSVGVTEKLGYVRSPNLQEKILPLCPDCEPTVGIGMFTAGSCLGACTNYLTMLMYHCTVSSHGGQRGWSNVC